MVKAAIYARVSTEGQADEEVPINGQIDECRKFAADKGWEVTEVFTDAGFSGRTDDRPAFRQMIEIIKSSPNPKPFDIILCWRSNRLFRSVEHRLAYSRVFRRHSIRFVAMHEPEFEGASAMFMETVLAAADELYVSQVSEDTLRGLKQIAMAGYSTGGKAATGYRNVRKVAGLKPNGEPILRTGWEPDPDYAPKIKRAFEMCASGASGPEIIKATGVVTSPSSLVSLLRNRAYLGERIYNVRKQVDGKNHRRKNPDARDIITTINAHEPLITEGLFQQVQAVLSRKRPCKGQYKRSKQTYILTGLLRCKHHDCLYIGNTNAERNYYVCSTRKKLCLTDSPCLNVKKEVIEAFILDNLKENLFTRKRIKAGLEAMNNERVKNRQDDSKDRQNILAKLNQLETELQRLYDAIAISNLTIEELENPIKERTELKSKLNAELIEIERQRIIDSKIPAVSETVIDEVLSKSLSVLTLSAVEIKAVLPQFIEWIELDGRKVNISYAVSDGATVAQYWYPQPVKSSKLRFTVKVTLPRDTFSRQTCRK